MRGGSNVLLTPQQAADKLGVSRKTVDRRWAEWGLRKIVLTARAIRFRERDIDNLIEARSYEC
jgi:predicted DNA-binding transcriptional regulator AlpA